MTVADGTIARIEALAGQDIQRRNIGPLVAQAQGGLAAAAASIASHPRPHVALITGFFLGHGEPPNCETDGPPGAATIAAGLAAVGIPCRLATDLVNARVLRVTAAAAGLDGRVPIDIVSMLDDGGDGAVPLGTVQRSWLDADPPISHVIAIERCGPSRDGTPRDARGVDIGAVNAPLDRLFTAGPWTRIGIGDLGNEIGMGSLPHALVAANVPNGDIIWCTTPCDHAIVCGISNWAAPALLAATALDRPDWSRSLLERATPAFAHRLLEAAVTQGGAVSKGGDGDPPRPWLAVDGMPWHELEPTYRRIGALCRSGLEAREAVDIEPSPPRP